MGIQNQCHDRKTDNFSVLDGKTDKNGGCIPRMVIQIIGEKKALRTKSAGLIVIFKEDI
jgi:hypothetical protein